MINSVDLRRIFGLTFGFVGLPFPEIVIESIPIVRKRSFEGPEFDFEPTDLKTTSAKGVSYYHLNSNGNSVFMPIWLSTVDNNALMYLLPNTVMSLGLQTHIVTTRLPNRHGTVKEEVADDDWEIKVRGIIVGKGNSYPEEEVQTLIDWRNNRQAFSIQNVKAAICLEEGERVVITRLNLPENRGFQNTQPYEIELLSDREYSLYID